MASGGSDSSWPMTLRNPAHPEHELVRQLLRHNRCDLCKGTIAGEHGYHCDACNFDVHAGCLKPDPRTTTNVARTALDTPGNHHLPPPPPLPRPSYAPVAPYHHYSGGHASAPHYPPPQPPPPPQQPQYHLSLAGQWSMHQHHHQHMGHHYPPPQHNNYGYYERGQGYGAPASYNHYQQQDYQNNANNQGGCMGGYNGDTGGYDDARDFGDMDDYCNDMDDF